MFARAAATALVLGIIAMAPADIGAADPGAAHQPSTGAATSAPNILDDDGRAPPTLAMFSQDFAVVAGEPWRARYEVFGPIGDELAAALSGPVLLAIDPETGLFDTTADTAVIDPLSDYSIRVTAHVPVASRAELIEVLNGLLTNALDGASVDPNAALRIGDDGIVEMDLTVPVATGGNLAAELELPRPGVYPITVEIRRRNELMARHLTFVERLDTDDRSGQHLVVVAAVEDPGMDPRPADLAELRLRLLELADLAEVANGDLTVHFPVAALDALDEDPELAERLRNALRGAEIIAVPAVPLDPSAVAEADRAAAYTRSLRLGEDRLVAALPTSQVRRTAWSGTPIPSASGATMLRDLGTRLLMVPYGDLIGLTSNPDPSLLVPVSLDDGTEMDLLAADPVSRLAAAELAGVRTPAERAVTVLAELAAHRSELGPRQRTAVIAPETGTIPDADVVAQLAAMADSHRGLELTSLTTAATSTDRRLGPASPLPDHQGPSLQRRADRIEATAVRAAAIASMLPSEDPRPGQWTTQFANLLSPAYSNLAVTEELRAIDTGADAITAAVELPDPFTFTLTGRTSEVDLRIVNTSDTPLSVVLEPASAKLAFPEGPIDTVLEPGLNIVPIPVQTLANGTFPVTITALTPLGASQIGETLTLTARANAVTGIGQVLTVGALLVLMSWWYSHLRGRRRARLAAETDAPADEHDDDHNRADDEAGQVPTGRSDAEASTDTIASP